MARIVSKLNLNKTPQLVESNSMIFAKNIKLLKDGSIGQDDSILPIPLTNTVLTTDINNIIQDLQDKVAYWNTKLEELEEQDSEVDLIQIYKDYITDNRFTDSGSIISAYSYTGGLTSDNPIFVIDNTQPTTQIPHVGNTILEEDAVDFFNDLNNTDHTKLGFPLIPKALFKHYGDIIFGPSKSYYDNFDYDRYFDAINSLAELDAQWYSENIEEFPPIYPDNSGYHVEYNGQVYHIQPLYGWMISWFLIMHGQQIQNLINEALHKATSDDNVIASQIKLLKEYIQKATKDIAYYTRCLEHINNIQNYTIVGVIPYNTEFYIFLYNDGDSLIIKYDEKAGFSICNCNWNYSGGMIDGNCVVNLNGDILLNIVEYKDDNTLLVPIKTINLTEANNSDDESIYTQIPRVHFCNLDFVEYYNNNIPAGTYQFFIRYEIRDNFYTNWFPASKELFAGTRKVSKTQQGTLQYIDDSIDSGSSFHFKLNKILYNDSLNFKSFQIGFILSHDDTVYARAWKKFNLDVTDIYFDYQTEYIEELDIEDLLNVPYGLFNVKNITNFKNKLYLSNYIESDFNPDLNEYINSVSVDIATKATTTQIDSYYTYPILIEEAGNKSYITKIDGENIKDIVLQLISQTKSYIDLGNYHDRTFEYKNVKLKITKTHEGEAISTPEYEYQLITDINHSNDIFTNNYNDIISFFTSGNTALTAIRIDNGVFYKSVPQDPATGYYALIEIVKAKYHGSIRYSLEFSIDTANVHLSHEIAKVDTTLMPGQEYDYYIHFVKETGEYTNGYKFGTTYIAVDDTNYKNDIEAHKVLYPVFTFRNTLPKGYVACFISIVHTKYNISEVFNVHSTTNTPSSNSIIVGDNIDLDIREYKDFDNLKLTNNGVVNYLASQDNSNWITFGGSGKIVGTGLTPGKNAFIEMAYESNSKYIQLRRITPYIVFNTSNYIYDNYSELNLFSYICNVRKLDDNFVYYIGGTEVYKKSSNFETGSNALNELSEQEFSNWLNIANASDPYIIYSNFNLNYINITLDLNPRIISKNFGSGGSNTSLRGIVVILDSINLSDIYELKSMYKDYTRKTYQPYTDKAIIKFDNTVRSSKLEGDEAKVNVFRFKATDYYNVPIDKGIIINMKAIGESILIHTQDSMFRFSGANSLTAAGGEEVAMKEGEPFETGIQEIFGSEFGFAGLQRKYQHTITENGYTFYDADAKMLYIYGGQQQVLPISDDIDKLLHRAEIEDIKFANDYYNDRIFIQISFADGFFATLSFNFRVKSFISLHDFKFENSFNTKTKCYFIKYNRLYVIAKSSQRSYGDLKEVDNLYPNKDGFFFNQHGIQFDSSEKCSIVDIIFKEEYANVKTLNALSWVCNKILGFNSTDNLHKLFVAEENLQPYAGGFLRLYTDSTATNLLEIYDSTNPYALRTVKNPDDSSKLIKLREEQRANYGPAPYVNLASYKYPRYNLGQWTFNYFRNILNNNDITDSKSMADQQSLIYGKYIVARFIFSNIDNFKLEDITFNIAPFK